MELWQLITLLLAFFGACAGAGKMLLSQTQRHIDSRFQSQEDARSVNHSQLAARLDRFESTSQNESSNWQRVERDFLRWQADIPLHYVRREDYIRGQSIIEAKLDSLGSKLEVAQLRAVTGSQNHAN